MKDFGRGLPSQPGRWTSARAASPTVQHAAVHQAHRGHPLATLDAKLRTSAQALGVALYLLTQNASPMLRGLSVVLDVTPFDISEVDLEEESATSHLDQTPTVGPSTEHLEPKQVWNGPPTEPHIDEQTMRVHHDKHHNTYVTALNEALEKLAAARDKSDFGPVVGNFAKALEVSVNAVLERVLRLAPMAANQLPISAMILLALIANGNLGSDASVPFWVIVASRSPVALSCTLRCE